jgi:hypothetical protein
MKPLYPVLIIGIGLLGMRASSQQPPPTDSDHFKDVDKRGDSAMGFSHEMTSHHFLLFRNGGAIEIEADSPNDSASKEAIRDHLIKIAGMFSQGDFQLPMLIHATVPPGVDTMKRLRDQINYAVEIAPKGALLRITTVNPEALKAVHDFLRFQIVDHRTNDPSEIKE